MELKPRKRVGLLCLIFAGSSISVYGQPSCNFNGLNVGGGLGLIDLRPSVSTTFTQNTLTADGKGHANGLGAKGNLFVGYSVTPNDWLYLGGELGLNLTNKREVTVHTNGGVNYTVTGTDATVGATGYANINIRTNNTTTATRRIIEPTLDVKPGLLITPNTVLYARVGMSFNTINIESKTGYNAVGNQSVNIPFVYSNTTSASTSQQFSQSNERNVIGWRAGFGLISMMSSNLGLSADYIYTSYNHGSLNRTSPGNQVACDIMEGCSVNPDGTYTSSSKTDVSDHEVLVQLVYYLQ